MKKKHKVIVLRKAKDFSTREMAGCGLVALTVKVTIGCCK